MQHITVLVCMVLLCGCATQEPQPQIEQSPHLVVERLFVTRLAEPKTFNFLQFWGLDDVKPSLSTPYLSAYARFQQTYRRANSPLSKWKRRPFTDLGSFPIYARNDPLTMCATSPYSAKVIKISNDNITAKYEVRYILQGTAEKYLSICHISLAKKNNSWVVTNSSVTLFEGIKPAPSTSSTYTFLSRLNLLEEKLLDLNRL